MINNDLGINIDKFEEYVQQIDKDYNIHFCDNSIYLDYKEFNVAKYVINDDFLCSYYLDGKVAKRIMFDDIVKLFYIYIKQHLKSKEYTIQVLPGEYGFLYKRNNGISDLTVIDLAEDSNYFTQSEIDELKKCKNIAIDWNKAIIKEVK